MNLNKWQNIPPVSLPRKAFEETWPNKTKESFRKMCDRQLVVEWKADVPKQHCPRKTLKPSSSGVECFGAPWPYANTMATVSMAIIGPPFFLFCVRMWKMKGCLDYLWDRRSLLSTNWCLGVREGIERRKWEVVRRSGVGGREERGSQNTSEWRITNGYQFVPSPF